MGDPQPTPTVLTPEEITQRAHDSSQQTTIVFWVLVAAAVLLAILYPVLRTAVARRRRRTWGHAEATSPQTTVTSRMSWGVLLLFVPVLTVLDAGLLVAVWRAVRAGDPGVLLGKGASTAGLLLAWCVLACFLLIVTGTIVWLLTYRVTITRDAVSTSAFFRTSRLRLADTRQISFVPERVRARRASPAQLRFDGAEGVRPRRVRITSGGGHFDHVLAVVDEWVRQRPDLVHDEATSALFADRGAVAG